MKILIDMDGVIVDIDQQFDRYWTALYPDLPLPDVRNRKEFLIGADQFPDSHIEKAYEMFKRKGYYLDPPFMKGAEQAIKELWASDHEIYFVTSASNTMPFAPSEKYIWIRNNLGAEYVNNLIICRDKSAIVGDVMIDDKPKMLNEDKAQWEHIIFDASYNKNIEGLRRLNWANWREVLDI